MLNRSRRSPAILLLLAAFVLISAAACSGVPTTPASPATGSVQDQLAQLAASAQPGPSSTATRIHATAQVRASQTPTLTRKPTRTPTATRASIDGLPTIALAKLPKEARDTIRLIQQGGPFPYRQDGATFGNREGLLPKHPAGYYQEYTVITPGSPDRGARRIIAGKGGELYYTDDHYDTFKRVVQ